ncbi:MAG: calcium-binding protein [Solirubrobacterales bacterium]
MNTVTFTAGLAEDSLSIRRVGDEIQFLSETFYGTVRGKGKRKRTVNHHLFRPAPCNVTPTVHNTDNIRIALNPDENADLDISLEGGALAPGASAEADGSSEIEVAVQLGSGDESVTFVGGAEADHFVFGSQQSMAGVNLNPDAEASPDVDATISPPVDPLDPEPTAVGAGAHTGAGDDVVTTSGGPGFDGPLGGFFEANGGPGNDSLSGGTSPFTFIKGATGADNIQGGPRINLLFGGGGPDTITGGPGRDIVELGKGRDLAVLDGGRDIVSAFDHMRDWVQCGDRPDLVGKDRKDRTPGCERKFFVPFHPKPLA